MKELFKKISNNKDSEGKLSNKYVHYLVISLILGVGALTLIGHTFAHSLKGHHDEVANHSERQDCTGSPAHTYKLVFNEKSTDPNVVTLNKCDEIVVTNNSNESVELAMGPHDHHMHVDGFEETLLKTGESYSFRISQSGNYTIHDHDNDELKADLAVN